MPQEKLLDAIVSTNHSERLDAAFSLDDQRRKAVAKLLSILESTNSDSVKMEAIIVLGEYRATEAVPVLVNHLEWDYTYPPKRMGIGSPQALEQFMESVGDIASASLWSIGSACIPALLDRIAETDETNISAKCVRICYRIEGRDLTQFRLQKLLDNATDQKKKLRVKSSLDFLKTISPLEMGPAGSLEVLQGLAAMEDTNYVHFLVESCVSIQGREMTEFQLHKLLERESDQKRKERIQSAIDDVDKTKVQK